MFAVRIVVLFGVVIIAAATAMAEAEKALPKPTPEQVAWQDAEVGMMICLDLITFSDLREPEWQKAGRLDPNLYAPTDLDTDQWMEAARAMGATYTVFVAKWCTGHLQWQSDLYPYGVRQSAWRDGQGDVIRDYVSSCRKHGIQPGLYASVTANAYWEVSNPGLVNWGKGGDDAKQAEYVGMSERMLEELWGNYGPFFEIWFDGGALPPEQGGPDLVPILQRLQPKAIVFQGPAASIRWIGNEKGVAGDPCWATVMQSEAAGDGDPNGTVWQPAECDVPIRNHEWFWNPDEEGKIYSLDALIDMYYRSVGRNANLIIGVTPDRTGRIPEADFQRAAEFGAEVRRRFGTSLAETSGHGDVVELPLSQPTVIDHVILMENIAEGERVREFVVEGLVGGEWQRLCGGQSVGHKRIDRFDPVEASSVRFRCLASVAEPMVRRLAVYRVGG
ncbi:MAG TPA: alpha-L-fucosidase [Candidatus Hydrogenedentes bacterium]|nr:alpha-L-fucosidase [Candidatus Hydrogenedentota bacterium]HPG68776.1 alpha-L-fucosidase [Candidatus Hydrogenedentota bacterium]